MKNKRKSIVIPRAYKRNAKTKLLWLYKIGMITMDNFYKCSNLV